MGLPKAESGVKVIRLQAFLAIDGVVATGTVSAAHPDLEEMNETSSVAFALKEPFAAFTVNQCSEMIQRVRFCACETTNLPKMRVSQRSSGFWVDYDDPHSRENLEHRT